MKHHEGNSVSFETGLLTRVTHSPENEDRHNGQGDRELECQDGIDLHIYINIRKLVH